MGKLYPYGVILLCPSTFPDIAWAQHLAFIKLATPSAFISFRKCPWYFQPFYVLGNSLSANILFSIFSNGIIAFRPLDKVCAFWRMVLRPNPTIRQSEAYHERAGKYWLYNLFRLPLWNFCLSCQNSLAGLCSYVQFAAPAQAAKWARPDAFAGINAAAIHSSFSLKAPSLVPVFVLLHEGYCMHAFPVGFLPGPWKQRRAIMATCYW